MNEFLSSDIEIYQVDSVQMLDSAMDESLTSNIEIKSLYCWLEIVAFILVVFDKFYQKPPK